MQIRLKLTWFVRWELIFRHVFLLLFLSLRIKFTINFAPIDGCVACALVFLWLGVNRSWRFSARCRRSLCGLWWGVSVTHHRLILKIAIAFYYSPCFLVPPVSHILDSVFIFSCLVQALYLFLHSSIMSNALRQRVITIFLRCWGMMTGNFRGKCQLFFISFILIVLLTLIWFIFLSFLKGV